MESEQVCEVKDEQSLTRIFLAFLRMGLTAFGGPAMIPYVRKMAVEQKKWVSGESFNDGLALCQIIPGATVMQVAAYIGLLIHGIPGALVSYIGFILPAFALMTGLSYGYSQTHELSAVVSVFSGLQAIIVAIVANAALSFGKTSLKTWRDGLIALIAAVLFWFMANPVLIIIISAFLGMILKAQPPAPKESSVKRGVPNTTTPLLLLIIAAGAGLFLLFMFRKDLFCLSVLMSRIDLFAFGGGFSSLPLMFHEIVEVRSWMDAQTFLNGIALGQFTPGPIVITATFVGYLMGGFVGALIATIGIFLPSFLILIGVAPWFDRIRSTRFAGAITGILCSFVGLLVIVTVRFGLNVSWDLAHTIFAAATFAALLFKLDILWVVLAATVISAFVI